MNAIRYAVVAVLSSAITAATLLALIVPAAEDEASRPDVQHSRHIDAPLVPTIDAMDEYRLGATQARRKTKARIAACFYPKDDPIWTTSWCDRKFYRDFILDKR